MKIGVIGYANNTGLGNYISNFRTHLPFDSQLIVRHPDKGTYPIDVPHSYCNILASKANLLEYLDIHSPDVIFIIETPFNDTFFEIIHSRNIKIIYVPMIDCRSVTVMKSFFPFIDAIINHTQYGHTLYEKKFSNAHYIPYPIDTDYFHPDRIAEDAPIWDFLHNQGKLPTRYL